MANLLPPLEYETWKDTCRTLHLWTQIAGKIRMCREPWTNHSWYTTLQVTSRGLGAVGIPYELGNFSFEIDLFDEVFKIQTSLGVEEVLKLRPESVSRTFERIVGALADLGIAVRFDPHPNELAEALSFKEDTRSRIFVGDQARDFFSALVFANNTLKKFRSKFVGKSSPVHFFWGSFDLAVTRFSGRWAPMHPGGIPHLPDRVTREAYSHEVCSFGFWPGNEMYPKAAFYSYAYPEPKGFSTTKIGAGFYHPEMREFILNYEEVRAAPEPETQVLGFCQTVWESASRLGNWDHDLEESSYRTECEKHLKPA